MFMTTDIHFAALQLGHSCCISTLSQLPFILIDRGTINQQQLICHYKIQRIFMSLPKQTQNSSSSELCTHCQTFYGSSAYLGLCSGCYKKGATNKKVEIAAEETEKVVRVLEEAAKPEVKEELQKDKKKCFSCNKKVGLLGTECKCCFVFCNAHRLPESHNCSFDFREKGQKDLEKTVVKVDNGKIVKM